MTGHPLNLKAYWMKSIRPLWLTLLIGSGVARAADPLSVCTVLESLRTYSGQEITVIGELESSMEVLLLRGIDCKKPFVTDGFSWPTALHIRYPDRNAGSTTARPESSGIEAFSQAIASASAKSRGAAAHGCVVITGILETKSEYVIRTFKDGTRRGSGFGHMGALPAAILMKAADIRSMHPMSAELTCACGLVKP